MLKEKQIRTEEPLTPVVETVRLSSLKGLGGRIGIFGGTFDPITLSDIQTAEAARERFNLDKVVFLLAGDNPSLQEQPHAPWEERAMLLERALQGRKDLLLCTGQPEGIYSSYTVETLQKITEEGASDLELSFLLSADNVADIPGWRQYEDIFDYANVLVADYEGSLLYSDLNRLRERDAFSPAIQRNLEKNVFQSDGRGRVSPGVRAQLERAEEPREPLPAGVLDLIRENKLYLPNENLAVSPAERDLEWLKSSHQSLVLPSTATKTREVGRIVTEVGRELEKTFEPFKVAISQRKFEPTRLEENFKKICQDIDAAEERNCKRIVFPELTIPGYLALDYFKNPSFIEANLRVLQKVIDYSKGKSIVLMVGFVDREGTNRFGEDNLYNATAIIRNGELVKRYHKQELAGGDILWERRYFKPGRLSGTFTIDGEKEAFLCCQEWWNQENGNNIAGELVQQGATRLYGSNASPWVIGKENTRYRIASKAASTHGVDVIFANLVGAYDGYEGDVLFDGQSMIFDDEGRLLGAGKPFSEELLIVDLKNPLRIEIPNHLTVQMVADGLVMGINDFWDRFGLGNGYTGISGGVDSAVIAAAFCHGPGADRFRGITMPMNGVTSGETLGDSYRLAERFGFSLQEIPIGKIFRENEDALRRTFGASSGLKRTLRQKFERSKIMELFSRKGWASFEADPISSLTKENLMARIRGQILTSLSNNDPGSVVLCPSNQSEFWNFTMYGDSVGAKQFMGDLDKQMVYALARWFDVPSSIVERKPTAELIPGQTDNDVMPKGLDYDVMAPLIRRVLDPQRTRPELKSLFGSKLAEDTEEVIDETIRKVRGNGDGFGKEWGHRQKPPGLRFTDNAVGSGRRIPEANRFDEREIESGWLKEV